MKKPFLKKRKSYQRKDKLESKRAEEKSSNPRSNYKERLKTLNKHINFDLEGSKTNSRKDFTEVTCVKCKKRFTLPFKPRHPEVYCDECFKIQKLKK